MTSQTNRHPQRPVVTQGIDRTAHVACMTFFSFRLRFEPGRGAAPTARGEAPFSSILIGVGIDARVMHEAFHDIGVVVQAFRP